MSLKSGMLGIVDLYEGFGEMELGANPGVRGGSPKVEFEASNREEVYGWLGRTLLHHGYERLSRMHETLSGAQGPGT